MIILNCVRKLFERCSRLERILHGFILLGVILPIAFGNITPYSFFREIRVIPCLKEILKLHPTPIPKH